MLVTYGRNSRYLGTGIVGKRGNGHSNAGTGMKNAYGSLVAGAETAGKRIGTNMDLGKGLLGNPKKVCDNGKTVMKVVGNLKTTPSVVEGSRFAVLNEEIVEEPVVKPNRNRITQQGKIPTKKVLAEISNRKPNSKSQVNSAASKYLIDTPIDKNFPRKPSKENNNETWVKKHVKGQSKNN